MWKKIQKWWYFRVQNPEVRRGEAGGFKWVFRRFWLDIETKSGNFKARFTAGEHPYGYLLAGKDDKNIEGYCQMIYTLGLLLTTDQRLVDDVQKAVKAYEKRLEGGIEIKEDETEEKIALETEKAIQEVVEMPKKERRKYERGVDGRFKAAVKKAEKLAE